jgi:hypothetical protein
MSDRDRLIEAMAKLDGIDEERDEAWRYVVMLIKREPGADYFPWAVGSPRGIARAARAVLAKKECDDAQ